MRVYYVYANLDVTTFESGSLQTLQLIIILSIKIR